MIQIGKKYKKWTILRQTDKRYKSGNILYECKCECGKIQLVSSSHILNKNRSFSCMNCAQRTKKMKINSYKNFINKKFGKWKVIKEIGRKKLNGSRYALFFECICECENISEVRACELKRKTSNQCRKCATKNNRYPCNLCKCKNHQDLSKFKNCELLGFCKQCDKFCCMKCAGDLNFHELSLIS